MVRQTLLVGLLTTLASACGDKSSSSEGDPKTVEPPVDPATAALGELRETMKALPPVDMRRVPMRETPQAAKDPRAATYYVKARELSTTAIGDVEPAEILGYADRWASAPAPLRAIGSGKPAIDAAERIAVGAGAPAGGTPLEPGETIDTYLAAGAVAMAAALEHAAAGGSEQAAWQLLGLVRMGQDLTRGTTADRVDSATVLIRAALAGLRTVVTSADRKALGDDALTGLLTGCQIVAASHPSYPSLAIAELTLWIESLAAGTAKTDTTEVGKRRADAKVIGELLSPALPRASQKQEKLHAHKVATWADGKAPSYMDVDRYARWLSAGADTHGTCLVMALELDRRSRKKNALAPALADLSPKPLEQPILDPLGARPWEYVDDGFGGRVLRSAPIVMGDGTVNVEMRIPKR